MHFTSKVLRSGEVKRKGSNIDMSWFLVILAWHNDLLDQELKPEKQFNIKDKIWSMKTRTKTSSKPKTHKKEIGKKKKKTDMKNIYGVRELTWSPAS